jgi:hypothetical protein
MSAKVGPEEQKRAARIGLVVHAGAARQPTRIINTIQEGDGPTGTHPKMRSGWAIKSVMRSSMLLGSRTNVGKVTLERSMPTLQMGAPRTRGICGRWGRVGSENDGGVRTLAGK